jgi:hypothetical protein
VEYWINLPNAVDGHIVRCHRLKRAGEIGCRPRPTDVPARDLADGMDAAVRSPGQRDPDRLPVDLLQCLLDDRLDRSLSRLPLGAGEIGPIIAKIDTERTSGHRRDGTAG